MTVFDYNNKGNVCNTQACIDFDNGKGNQTLTGINYYFSLAVKVEFSLVPVQNGGKSAIMSSSDGNLPFTKIELASSRHHF